VSACLNRLASLRKSKDILSKTKIAAIGPATARAARLARLKIAFQPESFIGESLVAEFPGYPELEGCCILWPRTNVGREYVLNCLEKAGARVDTVEAYRTIMPANSNELAGRLATLLKDRKIDVITLASSQTARNLARLIRLALATGQDEKEPLAQKMRNLLDSVTIASIGPQTSQTAVEEFGRADLQAREYTIDGLVAALVEYIQQNALHPT